MKKKITVRISNEIGNQLFMYASSYAIAERLNRSLFIDDESSDSFIIDGSTFSSKNADFNRRLAKYQSEMDIFKNEARAKLPKEEKKGAELSCPKYIEASRLYRKNH